MKLTYLIFALCACLISCAQGKSGPFTFTNKTGETVHVLITQDGTIAKSFSNDEKYIGKDYYTPTITFVKGIDSEANKSITDNRYTATTENGFDYDFVKAEGQKLVITASLGGDFSTAISTCYLVEANGKLGDYSDTVVTIEASSISATGSSSQAQTTASTTGAPFQCTLYTAAPEFRIYKDTDRKQDITGLFDLALGKSEIPPASSAGATSSGASGQQDPATPTVQWNLEISYPKAEPVE